MDNILELGRDAGMCACVGLLVFITKKHLTVFFSRTNTHVCEPPAVANNMKIQLTADCLPKHRSKGFACLTNLCSRINSISH